MLTLLDIVLILLIGAGAGVCTGIMGGSGVMVVVPTLTLLGILDVKEAIGASLLIDVFATLVTSAVYHRHDNVYLKPGLWVAAGSIVGAQIGGVAAHAIPSMGMSDLFGIFLIPMGVLIALRGVRRTVGEPEVALAEDDCEEQIGEPKVTLAADDCEAGENGSDGKGDANAGRRRTRGPEETWRSRAAAVALGLLVGLMCGMFGAGGGGMILLILLFVLHYPVHLAVGTSSLIMLLTAASGATRYALSGYLDGRSVAVALVASVTTVILARLGARMANRISERALGRAIGGVLAGLGAVMLLLRNMNA